MAELLHLVCPLRESEYIPTKREFATHGRLATGAGQERGVDVAGCEFALVEL